MFKVNFLEAADFTNICLIINYVNFIFVENLFTIKYIYVWVFHLQDT